LMLLESDVATSPGTPVVTGFSVLMAAAPC